MPPERDRVPAVQAHGVLAIDKPRGPTSHDVVAMARRALQTRAIGHAGTLDPMATGLLVLGVGEGRKLLRYLSVDNKRYEATIELGVETDSLDADGEVVRRAAVPADLSIERVRAAGERFLGVHMQRAPDVSAIKQGGVALHVRRRRGEVVEAPEREVQLRALDIVEVSPPHVRVRLDCSKGFYVRAFARDLAAALGTVGHLNALRRTASGTTNIEQAVDWQDVEQARQGDADARARLVAALLPVTNVLPAQRRVVLDAQGADDARHGRAVAREHMIGAAPAVGDEPLLLIDDTGAPIALARAQEANLRIFRGFNF
jgi:tRNA pseudouridine55 synthase